MAQISMPENGRIGLPSTLMKKNHDVKAPIAKQLSHKLETFCNYSPLSNLHQNGTKKQLFITQLQGAATANPSKI